MKIDVSYVAELARLELTEEEKATFQPQLESIVEYVDKISSVDVEGVPPMMHGRELVNVFREDVVGESLPAETALANAPARTGDEFLLTKIVGFGAVTKPCKLQREMALTIPQIYQLKAAVRGSFFPHGFQGKGLIVEFKALFKVKHIEIEMIEFKHYHLSFLIIHHT